MTTSPQARSAAAGPGAAPVPGVSVIVPCRNEARFIDRCLESILDSSYPSDALEVLVVDGRSDDGTPAIVARYAERHPNVRLLDNPRRVVPHALNAGVRAARGDVIVRMDAHAVYPPEYIPRLVAALDTFGADNVGGRMITMPSAPTRTARAIARAMTHPFGVGNARFRLEGGTPQWVDTVPFGCYRRSVFDRIGYFDEELVRNQDDQFNHRLLRRGGRILLLPDVASYYYTRASYAQLARMYYQYGVYKPLAAVKAGGVWTVRQLVPPAFLVTLAGLGLWATQTPAAALLWALVAGSYAVAALACGLTAAGLRDWHYGLAVATAFPVMHLSYGFGFLHGLGTLVPRRAGYRRNPEAVPLSR